MQQPSLLRVEAFDSRADLAPWRESLDALNLAARRPSPSRTPDSDDAWPPCHLALTSAAFDVIQKEDPVTSELWEMFGSVSHLRLIAAETSDRYARTARRRSSRRARLSRSSSRLAGAPGRVRRALGRPVRASA
jgi:hypothetical protein